MARFRRITIQAARRRFNENKAVYLCPHKMAPDGPYSPAALVFGREWLERAELYKGNEKLWAGTLEKTAWAIMLNNWKHYNASYETGYYPAYYVEVN
jgi:hypothetical protein